MIFRQEVVFKWIDKIFRRFYCGLKIEIQIFKKYYASVKQIAVILAIFIFV